MKSFVGSFGDESPRDRLLRKEEEIVSGPDIGVLHQFRSRVNELHHVVKLSPEAALDGSIQQRRFDLVAAKGKALNEIVMEVEGRSGFVEDRNGNMLWILKIKQFEYVLGTHHFPSNPSNGWTSCEIAVNCFEKYAGGGNYTMNERKRTEILESVEYSDKVRTDVCDTYGLNNEGWSVVPWSTTIPKG